MNGRRQLLRIFGLMTLVILVFGFAAVASARDEFQAPAPPEPKTYVNQYFIAAAMIGGGIWCLCRPSGRAKEPAFMREVQTATKEGANV